MSARRLLTSMGLALVAAACSETAGPANPPGVAANPQFSTTAGGGVPGTQLHYLRQGPTAPQLETYAVSFWAVKGKSASVKVKYKDAQSVIGGGLTYLQFDIPKDGLASRPDGTRIRAGDSLQITLTLDPATLKVEFQPSGLQFSTRAPASLKFWYVAADPDLNGDGVVDAADDGLYPQLSIWYTPDPTSPWTRLSSHVDLRQRWVTTGLYHFSGYAVSW